MVDLKRHIPPARPGAWRSRGAPGDSEGRASNGDGNQHAANDIRSADGVRRIQRRERLAAGTPLAMQCVVTLLSPRATSFQSRNSLDAGFDPGLDRRVALHPARVMLDALGRTMALRDPATAEHALRVQRLAVAVAQEACLGDAFLIAAIHAAAPLHDIGKLAIPDCLLQKPGPLSPEEYELVKRHAVMGGEILDGLEFGGPLARMVRHHHENWDGTGYPDALSAQTIPIGSRILAIVDCYDALTSERPYREPMTHARAVDLIVSRRCTMYDPAILDVFVRVVQRLRSGAAVVARHHFAAPSFRQQTVTAR